MLFHLFTLLLIAALALFGKPTVNGVFIATAYTIEGTTDGGIQTKDGVVAADNAVLPIGTRIRITGAGPYDGTYLVADSGSKITGRKIDIYIRNDVEAKKFGKKKVRVLVLSLGDGDLKPGNSKL